MKMAHITIHTAKIDESVAFYQEVLGMEISARFSGAGGKPIVFLGGDDSGVRIELIEDLADRYCGSGISVGFHVENVEEKHAALQSLHPSPMISPNPHTRFFFIKDPNGVSIQFI